MGKMKIVRTPATSEGARYERKAFRSMLRRRSLTYPDSRAYQDALDWVLKRSERYDKKPGGL